VVIKAWQREGRSWAEIDHSKGNGQMNKSRRSPHTFVFAITMLVAFPSSSPAQVRVLISGGFSAPYQELLPQFEKSTGITVTTARGASEGNKRQVRPRHLSRRQRPNLFFEGDLNIKEVL
jgi:hypothetical protein